MKDRNQNELQEKDEVIVRGTIIKLEGGVVVVELAADATKKYWIEAAHVELVPKPASASETEDAEIADADAALKTAEAEKTAT